MNLPAGPFGAILADPPWEFMARSPKGYAKTPQRHYACMDLPSIQAMPVADMAARDCALFMWATSPMLPQALATMAAWGFAYKATGAWAKRSSTGRAWAFGTGYIMRCAAEFYIVGTRGKPKRRSASVRNLVCANLREHSRKPDELRWDIEALYAGPYVELFAREAAPNWTAWGNQVGRFTPAATSHDAALKMAAD